MTRLFLVRHAQPAEKWGSDGDPGLTHNGQAQAEDCAARLGEFGALRVISSPTRRCKDTAAPAAKLLRQTVAIEPRISEISAPKGVGDPRDWVRANFSTQSSKKWGDLDQRMNGWRNDVLKAVRSIKNDSVVFTHFVAINAVMGAALNVDDTVVCRPDFASITEFALVGDDIRLVLNGNQIASEAG